MGYGWSVRLEGNSWGPIRAGLFGGSIQEFKAAVDEYSTKLLSRINWV